MLVAFIESELEVMKNRVVNERVIFSFPTVPNPDEDAYPLNADPTRGKGCFSLGFVG